MTTDAATGLFGDYGARSLIRISGRDAAAFLHSLCTQDVKSLKAGACSEAFVPNVQGKTIGYVRLFREESGVLLDTSAGQAQTLLSHFEKYHITEKVEFENLSNAARATIVSLDLVEAICVDHGCSEPLEQDRFAGLVISGAQVIVARRDVAGSRFAYCLTTSEESYANLITICRSAGGAELSSEEVSARRIVAGTPEFGADINDDNLPQEIGRDSQAISFVKGCYLGQETVARIDALGRVNRLLVKLRGEGRLDVRPNDEVVVGAKPVGRVTSVAYCDQHAFTLALGLVRRGSDADGTEVSVNGARLTVHR